AALIEAGLRGFEVLSGVDDVAAGCVRSLSDVGFGLSFIFGAGVGAGEYGQRGLRLLLHFGRNDLIVEHRDFFEHTLRFVGILDVRQFDQNAVAADVADRRLRDAESVDAAVDDLARLRLHLRRNGWDFRGGIELQQQTRSALEIEPQVNFLLHRQDRPYRKSDDGDDDQRLEWRLERIPVHRRPKRAVQTKGP